MRRLEVSGRAGAAPLAALLGGLFAFWMYGWRAIDPASAGWLLQGDPAQHYLGSVFFLNEPWQWPPGLITRFGEGPTSVVFTDAIPLVALLAKLAGVPGGLQYFGIWMLVCHALSGWFGVRLLQRLGAPTAACVIGGLFFTMSPALLMRAYGHEALMAHFLVLASLERALAPWRWPGWLAWACIAVLVHPYLAAMVGLLGAGAACAALLERKVGVAKLALQGAVSVAVLYAVAWSAGYFVGSGQLSAAGHGVFSSNLLTWVDRMDWAEFNHRYGTGTRYSSEWSRFLPALGQATPGQYEGFAYLGAGMLALVGAAGIASVMSRVSGRGTATVAAASGRSVPRVRRVCALVVCIALALLAVSARPSFGAHVLAEIPLSEGIINALGVFRASGRFIWPLTYLLMAWAIARVCMLPGSVWLLMLLVVLQVADLNGKFKEFRGRFRVGPPQLSQPVASPLWAEILRRCPNLQMVSAAHPGWGWISGGLAAGLAGARFYPAPTARFSPEAEAQRQAGVQRLFNENAWRPDTVYLLALPLPAGVTAQNVAERLPSGMAHQQADGLDLVFSGRCRGG